MKIYLTRHSRTMWNEEYRLQGRGDSPLTAFGVDNAKHLRDHLKHIPFDKIYSSPLGRALDTAHIVFDPQDISVDDRLIEMDFGRFEKHRISDLSPEDLRVYKALWNQPETQNGLPEGETYDEIEERARDFLADITSKNDGNVAVVTHGFMFIILMGIIMGLERKDYTKINNPVVTGCSTTIVTYEKGHYHVDVFGDQSYLPHKTVENFAAN